MCGSVVMMRSQQNLPSHRVPSLARAAGAPEYQVNIENGALGVWGSVPDLKVLPEVRVLGGKCS